MAAAPILRPELSEGKTGILPIVNSHAGSFISALYARLLLILVLGMAAACTKDETGGKAASQDGSPEIYAPVTAREWYPTPKPSGYSTASSRSPTPAGNTTDPDRQPEIYRQYPEWDAATRRQRSQGSPGNEWSPATPENRKYTPWQVQQAPQDTLDQPVTRGTRRPWGEPDFQGRSARRQQPEHRWRLQPGQGYGHGYGYGYGYGDNYSNGYPYRGYPGRGGFGR